MDESPEAVQHEGELHQPVGTAFIMGLYLLAMIGTWAWVFLVLEGRS